MIHAWPIWTPIKVEHDPEQVISTVSHSNTWTRQLSPFVLGPVRLYSGYKALNVENAWQYAKVYREHVDGHGDVLPAYWEWAQRGWANPRAVRYPMGKGRVPLFSLWDGQRLDYVTARKQIYCPLYAKVVRKTEAYKRLKELYVKYDELWLLDFDAYDHLEKGMSYKEVLNNPHKKMGHAFVLAMCLDHQRVWEKQ